MKQPIPPNRPKESEYQYEYTEHPLIFKHLVHSDRYREGCLDGSNYQNTYKYLHNWKEGDPMPEIIEFWYDNEMCTLADIIKAIPTGVLPSEVVIHLKRDRQSEYIDFIVNARKPTDKTLLENQYKEDMKSYELKLNEYQKQVIAYQSWKAQEDIRNKEQEINALKEQIAKMKK